MCEHGPPYASGPGRLTRAVIGRTSPLGLRRGQRDAPSRMGRSTGSTRAVRKLVRMALIDRFESEHARQFRDGVLSFGWHQDCGFIDHAQTTDLACWNALDDVSGANGAVHLPPYGAPASATSSSTCTTRRPTTRSATSATTRRSGVHPAWASRAFRERSSIAAARTPSDSMRRVYVAQCSAEPILDEHGSAPGTDWVERRSSTSPSRSRSRPITRSGSWPSRSRRTTPATPASGRSRGRVRGRGARPLRPRRAAHQRRPRQNV